MLTDQQIRTEASGDTVYIRGCQYFTGGRVKKAHMTAPGIFQADVVGSDLYRVHIDFDQEQEIHNYRCTCPAFFSHDYGACKHIIAVLKVIQKNWDNCFGTDHLQLTPAIKGLLDFFKQAAVLPVGPEVPRTTVFLVPTYHITTDYFGSTHWLDFTIGSEKMYVVKDLTALLDAVEQDKELVFGKNFTLLPKLAEFEPVSKALLEMLLEVYQEEQQSRRWRYNYESVAFRHKRQFMLTDRNLVRFFKLMGKRPFAMADQQNNVAQVSIKEERPELTLAVKGADGGLTVEMSSELQQLVGLDERFRYIYYNGYIYKVDQVFGSYVRELLQCFAGSKMQPIQIPATAASDFVSAVLPALETVAEITVEPQVYGRFYRRPLERRVYFDQYREGISARVEFGYGDVVINPAQQKDDGQSSHQGKWLLRSYAEEQQVTDLLARHGFTIDKDVYVLPDEEATYDFLHQGIGDMQELADVFYADGFKRMEIRPAGRVSAGVRLNQEIDMLEFTLSYEDMSPKELLELLAAYKLKKKYHRLKDGSFITLDSAEFQTAALLVDNLGLKSTDIEKQIVKLPKYRALYLDSLARDCDDFYLERNAAFRQLVQEVKEPKEIECAIPAGINGKLREYQKTGFKWLKALALNGLGGILADDMGLGKTLQVIAFVLSEKAKHNLPSLVIAPTSLVYNWQDEVNKFAPSLQVAVISGQQDVRLTQMEAIETADLVVTSYALLRRDIELYEQKQFQYCFLDEAQHIKNPNTLSAQAVKRVKAKSYFALTGTPIENTLSELWSIFDFVMPGYLKSHKQFLSRFEIPIVKNGDEQALKELSRHIKPFILRRMKKAVLKELPEKVETKLLSEMSEEQALLYRAWLLKARDEFETEVSTNGFEKSQIKILSLLTRLRQLCCHPSLFIDNYQGGSGKLSLLQEVMKDAVSGGHRVLLFSQFTSMLDIIRQELVKEDISYYYLDGATPAEERIKMVHAFNAGQKEVFLLSLKAGGTGLNLTGADVVIHFDPWWNPAVEDQATDRAYRIGQKNSVQVYKLIAKDTIEEKIYALQQKKQVMIESLIKPGENFLTKMSESEIRELFM